ncbi:MAG: hypothetical protein J0I93_06435 [Legionella sp.]|nr:hypothetical protein [Legionella sp.]
MGSRYQDSQLYSLLDALTKNTQTLLKTHAHLRKTDDYKTIEKLNKSLVALHKTYFPKFPSDVWPWVKNEIKDHLKILRNEFPPIIGSNLMLQFVLLFQNFLTQLPENLTQVLPFIEDTNLNTDIAFPKVIKLQNVKGERFVYDFNGKRIDFKSEYENGLIQQQDLFQNRLINYYLKKDAAETYSELGIAQCIQSLQSLQQREDNLQNISFMTLLDDEEDPVIKENATNLISQLPWITQSISDKKPSLTEQLSLRLKSQLGNEQFQLLSTLCSLLSKLTVIESENIDAKELEHRKSQITQVEEFLTNYACPDALNDIKSSVIETLKILKTQLNSITLQKTFKNLVPEIENFNEDSLSADYIVNPKDEVILAKLKGELEVHSPHNVKLILEHLPELMAKFNLKINLYATPLTKKGVLATADEIQKQIRKQIPGDLEEFLNLLLSIRLEKNYDYDYISKKCSEIKVDPHQYGLDQIPKRSAQAERFIDKKIQEISEHQKNPLINSGRILISLVAQLRLAADYIDESFVYSELIAANELIIHGDLSDIQFDFYVNQLQTLQVNMKQLIDRHFNTTHDQKYPLYKLFNFSAYHHIIDNLKQKLVSMTKPIIATAENIDSLQHDLQNIEKIINLLKNKYILRFVDNSMSTNNLSESYDSVSFKIAELKTSLDLRITVVNEVQRLLQQFEIPGIQSLLDNYRTNGVVTDLIKKLNSLPYTDANSYSIINKAKVKLLEYERTAPHNLRESVNTEGQTDYSKAIADLKNAIKTIKNERWEKAHQLSTQLRDDLEFFSTHYGTKPTAAEFSNFKELFLARIHSHEVTIRNHRAIWKPILANILIGLFSFGFALGIRLAHTYRKNGTPTLFFNKTQKENDVEAIEEVFSQQAPAA